MKGAESGAGESLVLAFEFTVAFQVHLTYSGI